MLSESKNNMTIQCNEINEMFKATTKLENYLDKGIMNDKEITSKLDKNKKFSENIKNSTKRCLNYSEI